MEEAQDVGIGDGISGLVAESFHGLVQPDRNVCKEKTKWEK